MILQWGIFTGLLIFSLGAIVIFFSLMFSLTKLWFRALIKIAVEEKVKAYTAMFDLLMGKVTMTATREALQHIEPSSKIN